MFIEVLRTLGVAAICGLALLWMFLLLFLQVNPEYRRLYNCGLDHLGAYVCEVAP